MERLRQLLVEYASRTDARWWIGQRPDLAGNQLLAAITGQVGLPTSEYDVLSGDSLIPLGNAQAAHVLAVAGTTSLAWDDALPSADHVARAGAALQEFDPDASFFSNGDWNSSGSRGWMGLTPATFDCGLIGFDEKNAFIFWIEEQD